MSSLPSGWTECALGDMGTWIGGGTPTKGQSRYWKNGTIPWVSPKDMKQETLYDAEDHITKVALRESATHLVPAGSVLIVTRSGILRRTLPVAINAVPVTVNQDIKAIVPRADVDAKFLSWALRAHERQILHECSKTGTTVQSIEMPRLRAFTVPLPPLDEQRRIAAALDERLSDLAAAITMLERARVNADRLTRAIRERLIAPFASVPLGQLLAEPLANGRSVPTATSGFPVLRLNALRAGGVDLRQCKIGNWSAADALRFVCRQGDFLVARGNGSRHLVGRGGLVGHVETPVAFPDTLIRVRTNDARLSAEYLRLAWDSVAVRRQIEGRARTTAGIYKISQPDIEAILLPLPSRDAQGAIVTDADAAFVETARLSAAVDVQLARAKKLEASVLRCAFDGTLLAPPVEGRQRKSPPTRAASSPAPAARPRRRSARRR